MVQGSSSGLFSVPGFGNQGRNTAVLSETTVAVAKPRYPLPEHTWAGANCSTHYTATGLFIRLKKSYVLLMGLINVTPKSII